MTVPNLLSCLRLGMIPVLLGIAWNGHPQLFLVLLVASLLTDLLDGFLARKLNQVSELGARLDRWADVITYFAIAIAGWWLQSLSSGRCKKGS
jgi:Phosphatidylglycerophosphate synthase